MSCNNRILLIGRPDHSMLIYRSLLLQTKLDFKFLTFKVVPSWIRFFTKNRRLQFVSKKVVIHIRTTIINLLNSKFGCSIDETNCMGHVVSRTLNKTNYKLIHYWPKYCFSAINSYREKHPDVITLADVHMPNPSYVLRIMDDIYAKYGMNVNNGFLSQYAQEIKLHLQKEPNIIVPSSYVVDTMKVDFPDKKYYIVPYGITISPHYVKKETVSGCKRIYKFVYAGAISIEKGCDFLINWFCNHQDYELHLFGSVPQSQQFIFKPYYKTKNIVFHGSVPKEEIQHYLCQYHVGIHLSRFDAYPLAVGEMVGCGLPVIVSVQTGIKDEVLANNWGKVVNLDDDSLDNAIQEITTSDNYNTFISNIDQYIKSQPKSFGERMIDLYNELINN